MKHPELLILSGLGLLSATLGFGLYRVSNEIHEQSQRLQEQTKAIRESNESLATEINVLHVDLVNARNHAPLTISEGKILEREKAEADAFMHQVGLDR